MDWQDAAREAKHELGYILLNFSLSEEVYVESRTDSWRPQSESWIDLTESNDEIDV